MITTICSDSANLGDNLAITPLLNHTPCRLNLLKEEWMEFTAPIFNGLCEINWVADRKDIAPPPYANIPRPWSKRLLVGLGFNDVPAIPKIKLTARELEEGQIVARKLQEHFGKPLCVLKAVPGRSPDRNVPTEIIDRIVAENPETQFVTFNLTDNHLKASMRSPAIKGVFEIANLPIRAEAAVYAAIGRYVGADTGCYHLMLAVGGKADVLCPAHSGTYNWWLTHYGDDCWLDEPVRVSYQPFSDLLSAGVTGIKL